MNRVIVVFKYVMSAMLGYVWGIISTVWLGYSILIAGSFLSEPGSYEYEYEDKSFQNLGVFGCILYVVTFLLLCYCMKDKKRYLMLSLSFMVLGIAGIMIYILN